MILDGTWAIHLHCHCPVFNDSRSPPIYVLQVVYSMDLHVQGPWMVNKWKGLLEDLEDLVPVLGWSHVSQPP